MRYVVDGLIIKAWADYDQPSWKYNRLWMGDDLDYKFELYFYRKNKIYKQKVINNDGSFTVVKTEVVYSF